MTDRPMPAPVVPDRLFIDGKWVAPVDGGSRESIDPFTSKPWATLPEAGEDDVRSAVTAASRALEGDWGPMSGRDRRKVLLRIADVIGSRAEELALTESYDNGKLLREMRGQLDGLPDCRQDLREPLTQLCGSEPEAGKDVFVRRAPEWGPTDDELDDLAVKRIHSLFLGVRPVYCAWDV